MNQSSTDLRVVFGVAFALQVIAVVIIVFGDIGFDRPGRFGLSFESVIGLAILWVAASIASFLLAWASRRPMLLWLQCALFFLTVGGGLLAAWWASSGAPVQPAFQSVPSGK